TYEELSDKEKLQADCDLKATKIVLQGLPPDVYDLVNHHKIAKDIWDRVKLLMHGTSLSKKERGCKLHDEFDKFSYAKARDLYTSNYDKLSAYLKQHEVHANEALVMHERFPDLLALVANYHQQPSHFNNYYSQYTTPQYQQQLSPPIQHFHTQPFVPQNAYPPPTIQQQPQAEFPQLDSGLEVLEFLPGDDPIAYMNKAMTFLSAVFTPHYPSTNNQLRSSSNPRNQATVQDGRVIVQQVQGRQALNVVGSGSQHSGEGHMARQCTQPKRRRDATRFKENVLLVQAQAEGKELDEEQLSFLADLGVADGQVAQTITHNAAFQTDDLDAYDFDYILSEVPYSDTFQNDMMNQSVQELQYSEQTPIVDYLDNEITSDSNIIPYSQYLEETHQAIVQNTNTSAQQNSMILSMFEQMSNHATNWDKANYESKIVNESLTAELERYKERVKILERRFNVDLSSHEKFIDSQIDDMIRMKNAKFAAFETEIDTLKQTLYKHIKEKESLLTTLNGFKTEFKERESKSIDKVIVLENQNKELENIV
ncbi:hypothetical protein Tco_1038601, partial [Tanacetum coccineum]